MTLLSSLFGTKVLGFFLMYFAEELDMSLYGIASKLTYPGWIVIFTLLIMTIYIIAIGIERYMTYNKAKAESRQYAPKVAQALKNNNIDEAINISDRHKNSHLAMVVSSGLKEFSAHQGNSDISGEEMEASKRATARAMAIKTAELKRGLSGLATVGSTAPFVGLFGTVVGIIGAFVALAKSGGSGGIGQVGGSIAEALITTAFGIAVAVPAVWLFNYFTNKVSSFGIEMENSASELIDYFIKQKSKQLKG